MATGYPLQDDELTQADFAIALSAMPTHKSHWSATDERRALYLDLARMSEGLTFIDEARGFRFPCVRASFGYLEDIMAAIPQAAVQAGAISNEMGIFQGRHDSIVEDQKGGYAAGAQAPSIRAALLYDVKKDEVVGLSGAGRVALAMLDAEFSGQFSPQNLRERGLDYFNKQLEAAGFDPMTMPAPKADRQGAAPKPDAPDGTGRPMRP
ncbi:MAG: hypothetical protein KI792_09100 [Alphaproteobacteria bacterium]|nr:hypothetical protein [Alphaproteobacteria bacterium SS10]